MHHQTFLSLFRRIQSCPTAPFHEHLVEAEIRSVLAEIPEVSVSSDGFGNLIAHYQRGGSRSKMTGLAFGAHMDHPGWVRTKDDLSGKTFLGGVPKDRLEKCAVEWFDDGAFGMWKLKPFEVRDGKIRSRVCDDLVGCASILGLFHELSRARVNASCYGIFSRAEEVGFVGAVKLAQNWPLPKGVRFVSLETSAPRGGAKMGEGPVIRVGDRMSVFDDGVTAELVDAASAEKIPAQRCLLDGGSL